MTSISEWGYTIVIGLQFGQLILWWAYDTIPTCISWRIVICIENPNSSFGSFAQHDKSRPAHERPSSDSWETTPERPPLSVIMRRSGIIPG